MRTYQAGGSLDPAAVCHSVRPRLASLQQLLQPRSCQARTRQAVSEQSQPPARQGRRAARPRLASVAATMCWGAALLCAAPAMAEKQNIVRLTKYNFDSNIRSGDWFVKFYAPWCTHCQRLAPIWEKLADQAVKADWPVKIAEVDCTQSKDVCEKVQVKGFPMLALISHGKLKAKYQGEASVHQFEEWLETQDVLNADGAKAKSLVGAPLDDTKGPSGSVAIASHRAVAGALLYNLVTRFPTKSLIHNMYYYSVLLLAFVIGGLCICFKNGGEEEDHDKDD